MHSNGQRLNNCKNLTLWTSSGSHHINRPLTTRNTLWSHFCIFIIRNGHYDVLRARDCIIIGSFRKVWLTFQIKKWITLSLWRTLSYLPSFLHINYRFMCIWNLKSLIVAFTFDAAIRRTHSHFVGIHLHPLHIMIASYQRSYDPDSLHSLEQAETTVSFL